MTELTIVRVVEAEPELVWRAWTEPDRWAAWLWPERFATQVAIDAQVGGSYRVASSPMGMAISGTYRHLIHPSVLEFTWSWDGEPDVTDLSVTLAPVDEGTRLTLHHSGFTSDDARDLHVQGWNDCLDRLPGHLAQPSG